MKTQIQKTSNSLFQISRSFFLAFSALLSGASATQAQASRDHLHTEIIIHASAERVWQILIDNAAWKSWNPLFLNSEGAIVKGKKIRNTMEMDGKEYVFKPKILVCEENVQLIWRGRFLMPGILDGKHNFKLEVLGPNKVRLVHSESFKGIMSGWMRKNHAAKTLEKFEAMNLALKKRVED